MRLPKINQKVSLRVPTGPWAGVYSSYVDEIGQEAIIIAHPMFGGENVPLPQGMSLQMEFIEGNERYLFFTRVLGLSNRGVPVVSLALPSPGDIEHYQQRDFVRLDANLPLRFSPLPDQPAEGEKAEPAYQVGRTLDISGGGAQIVVDMAYPAGTKLALLLNIKGEILALEAQVVRLVQQVGPKEARLGVRFTRVEKRDRERIVRYIFSEQRSRRQKGLI